MTETPEVRYLRKTAESLHQLASGYGQVVAGCLIRDADTWQAAANAVAAIQRGDSPIRKEAAAQSNARRCHHSGGAR